MALWEHMTVTDAGRALQAKLNAGNKMVFTKFVTGNSTVPAVSLYQQTAVASPVQEFLFSDNPYYSSDQPDEASLSLVVSNANVARGYNCYQIGIFAEDPDEGEILYVILQTTEPTIVPTASENPGWSTEFNVTLKYGGADVVHVYVNASGMLTRQTADKRYGKKVSYGGKLYEFKKDENGVYLAEVEDDNSGGSTEVTTISDADWAKMYETFLSKTAGVTWGELKGVAKGS